MRNARAGVQNLEKRWQVPLPEAFHRLYEEYQYPFISPCEFLPLDDLLVDTERWLGMLPQFLPFGHDGAYDVYGFFVPPFTSRDDYPVLYWDHEYDHYYPVASGFLPFLRWCVINGRYLSDEAAEDESQRAEDDEQRREFVRLLDLPSDLNYGNPPRNDTELYERIAASDPQAPHALAQLGTLSMAHGNIERARDFYVRSSEVTPWFADPYYLLAETYCSERNAREAVARWWRVLLCPIALSTRTSNYDLGADHPESEIHEAAIEALVRHADSLSDEQRRSPLGRLILEGDPAEPSERLELASQLEACGDLVGQERELLNAVTLATEESDITRSYDLLIAFYDRINRHREAAFCRHDRHA